MGVSSSGLAQETSKPVRFFDPPAVPVAKGYSQAVEIDLGSSKMIMLSGQVPLNKEGELVGSNDLSKQAEQVFINIRHIVEEAGGSMNDIVKLNYYMINVGEIKLLRAVRDRFINIKTPPTSTLVQVSKLFRDDVLIEIEATAVISKNK
ncbi:endoribonuclease L-PSP [Pedobacter lusitanus]|uniref:Contig13, whole genome shotgun sequence n=1 Tax=Pedobacter lusitanus TaxID=1503925 RepID=A0A0D0GQP2_9SPHI|nr:endoribonuclease L-PSP [Pedobacter lusitanus]